jgi:toxin-antitoxin system PIN domain toxin
MLLPDINVWLALTFDSHVHHPAAKTWFDALSNEACYFCRMTQQGFLRLATNRAAFGSHALTMADAWRKYDTFQSDVRIAFAEEPVGLEAGWRGYTQHQSFSPHMWNDAYLAAFAKASGLAIVTFDQAFSHYSGVNLRLLP